jgi:protocatechuate 3,4-dioxygenase beta subunit
MKKIIFACLFLVNGIAACAQPDSVDLLKEVTTQLRNNPVALSAVLTDKKYLSLHAATPFRELIKAYANTEIIKMTTAEEPGKKIKVLGKVMDHQGKPVAGALVYLYQTDSRGWYAADAPHVLQHEGDFRHARLFGYVKTGVDGQFELHTVKPSGYPRSDLPAHIHVQVSAAGYNVYGTEFLFDDDERLKGTIRDQAIQNHFLISKPDQVTAPFDQMFSYIIRLQKE